MTGQTASEKLRAPFPEGTVGKLPKGGMLLDFVGHAAVTDRLLTVDPNWTWEPLALDAHGLPALDNEGNLWIRLTVDGVTRLGVGDGRNAKERIGDALRNAAMRFGVALSLWSKDELESGIAEHREPKSTHRPETLPVPPIKQAQARAWNAVTAVHPQWTRDERQAAVATRLESDFDVKPQEATVEQWEGVAESFEAERKSA